jgi:hypothetical protein
MRPVQAEIAEESRAHSILGSALHVYLIGAVAVRVMPADVIRWAQRAYVAAKGKSVFVRIFLDFHADTLYLFALPEPGESTVPSYRGVLPGKTASRCEARVEIADSLSVYGSIRDPWPAMCA